MGFIQKSDQLREYMFGPRRWSVETVCHQHQRYYHSLTDEYIYPILVVQQAGCIGVNYVYKSQSDGQQTCQIITSGWFPSARTEASTAEIPFQGTARKGSCEDVDSNNAMNSQYIYGVFASRKLIKRS